MPATNPNIGPDGKLMPTMPIIVKDARVRKDA